MTVKPGSAGSGTRVGEAIGVGVIAECVEDQNILMRLKTLDVGYLQGFGILEPYAIEKIAQVPG